MSEEYEIQSIDILKVGNGTKDYPGNFTKKEVNIINSFSTGKIINIFSGKSKIGDLRLDFSCKEATNNCDVFEYLEYNDLNK